MSADRVLWQSRVWAQSTLEHQEQTLSPTKGNPYPDSKLMNRLRREAEDRDQTNSLITANERNLVRSQTSGTAVLGLMPRYYLTLLLPKADRQGVNWEFPTLDGSSSLYLEVTFSWFILPPFTKPYWRFFTSIPSIIKKTKVAWVLVQIWPLCLGY